MLNNNISNYIPIRRITNTNAENPLNQAKQRASSTNIDKLRSQSNVLPYNSIIKKTNNHVLKSISVNKQIQYQKKNLSKNTEIVYSSSYNGIAGFKANYNTINKLSKKSININNNTNPKNERVSHISNYSNNKLRRKMILSVDVNNGKNGKNISQHDLNNNIKYITEFDTGKNKENESSNPMSNGAKNSSKETNNKSYMTKSKSIKVNHITKNYSQNNLMKSPEIKNNNKNNNSNTTENKALNINIKQSLKFLIQPNNTSNIYQANFTTGNEKKYIKPNLKNSSSNYYKLNSNENSKYNIYDNNNSYKIMKDIVEIQTEMEKKLRDNITNSKSRKYNALKNTFEILLKYLGKTVFKSNNVIINILLEKILIGYHEVVNAFSSENRKLKQINYHLNEQYEKMSKDLFNTNKIIKEKQKLIDNLQKKITSLEKGINKKNIFQNQKNNNIKIINKGNICSNKNEQNIKVFELNKKNLEDLDALYFYDKIKDNKVINDKKRTVSIPKIIIKQKEEQNEEEEEEDEYDNECMNKTVIFSNIWGMFIGLENIKFTSEDFIKIREAFII